jgi:hypothetical protein
MAANSSFTIKDKAAKEEFRRLTQLANRRIAAAMKAYEKEGKDIAPYDVTGGIQTREQWESKNYALSRSIKFTSEQEYRKHLHFLRQFEHMRPGIKEYTQVQREKTLAGMETALGEVPEALEKLINQMSAPQLSDFWDKFSSSARRQGFKYASDAAMNDAVQDFFSEDKQGVATAGLAADIKSKQLVKGKAVKVKLDKKKTAAKKKTPKKKRAKKKAAKKKS